MVRWVGAVGMYLAVAPLVGCLAVLFGVEGTAWMAQEVEQEEEEEGVTV